MEKDEAKRYEYTRNGMTFTTPNILAAILRKDTELITAYYEDGTVKNPGMLTIYKIFLVLNTTFDEFVKYFKNKR